MWISTEAIAQKHLLFSPGGRAKIQNQYFICYFCLFNLAVWTMFWRNNEKTGLKKKLRSFVFSPSKYVWSPWTSPPVSGLAFKDCNVLKYLGIRFQLLQSPRGIFTLYSSLCKEYKMRSVFMSPPTKASNTLTLNNKFGMKNLVLVNVF